MVSYNLQRVNFTIPSCPEITSIRQFQKPSLYQTLGILLLKLVARYRRNEIISNNLCESLKGMCIESIKCYPSDEEYINYFYSVIDYILKQDNELKALEDINGMIPRNNFLPWISKAIKAILLTITKDKIYVTPDLKNDINFGKHNTTIFTSLMNKFDIAINLYFFNQKYETFYPRKIGVYPFMHILFNETEGNNLDFNSYIEIYTDDLYKLESSNNNISVEDLKSSPFSYSNGPTSSFIETEVTLSASLLDNFLNEIIRANNELPTHILNQISAITGKNDVIATLPSLVNLRNMGNLVAVQRCELCDEDKEMKFFPSSRCKGCIVCIDCRLDSLIQCQKCYRNIDKDEGERFKKFKASIT